jgi:hypothetical protein
MRATLAVLVLTLATRAAADPAPPDHSADVAAAVAKAIKAGDAKALAAQLSPSLMFYAGDLFVSDCKKVFGVSRTVNSSELPAFATCLLGIDHLADYVVIGHAGSGAAERFEPPTDDHAVHVYVKPGERIANLVFVVAKRDPDAPQNVTPSVLNAYRISGQTQIVPDAKTLEAIKKSGKKKVVSAVKLCLKATGDISGVTVMKSTGFPAYDKLIVDTVGTWKYKPFLVDGKPAPACTGVMFIYQVS